MKIGIILGTRPEIIKVAPVIRYCIKEKLDFFVIHTGQHYSYNMDKIFFEEMEIPEPKYQLNIKSSAPHKQGEHTGKMIIKIEEILLDEEPDSILVHGDTNTALSGALCAVKISTTKDYTGRFIHVGHIESGLRSFDRSMPEEVNRVIVDHLSNAVFPPTKSGNQNLLNEGIKPEKIHITGNTIVDAVMQNLKLSKKKFNVLEKLGLNDKGYFLVTAHRQESVDVKDRLQNIITALEMIKQEFKIPVVYPIHPRTMKMLEKFEIIVPKSINIIEPLGFLEFLQLESHAKMTLTDSGGVQEESCILKVPCITLRNNTERPETLESGANMIGGYDPETILGCVRQMLDKKTDWKNPFGDGNAAKKIIDCMSELS